MPSSGNPPINTLATRWSACKGEVPPPLVGAAAVAVDDDHFSIPSHSQASSSQQGLAGGLNSKNGKLFLFAGRLASNRKMTNDLFCLDLATLVWSKIPTTIPSSAKASQTERASRGHTKFPTPRYFHSCDLWRGKLVVFGGMGYNSRLARSEATAAASTSGDATSGEKAKAKAVDPLFVMNEVLLFDLATMRWDEEYVPRPGPVAGPAPRYAHLSAITGDLLVIIGGQNINNKYVEEINVFDLIQRQWIVCEKLDRQCGSYRSLAVSSPWIVEGNLRASVLVDAVTTRKRAGSKASISTNFSSANFHSSPLMGRPRGLSSVSSTIPYEGGPDSTSSSRRMSVGSAQELRRAGAAPEDLSAQGEGVHSNGTTPQSLDGKSFKGRGGSSCSISKSQHLPMSRPIMAQDANPPLYLYSNYNFTDVKRELEVIKVSARGKFEQGYQGNLEDKTSPSLEFEDHSASMQGLAASAGLPPGLRFPAGVIVGNHLLVSGTYLANTSQAFSVWALYLPRLTWTRLDMGPLINQGSWNRASVSTRRGQMFIFGHRERDLVTDYNHRQTNWDHMLTFDLEAWGISQPPPRPTSDQGIELGIKKLESAMACSVYQSASAAFAKRRSNFNSNTDSIIDSKTWLATLPDQQQQPPLIPGVFGTGGDFEIVCSDEIRIGCDRIVLETRWPWFRQRLARYRAQARAAADLVQERRGARQGPLRISLEQGVSRTSPSSKERALAALRSAASEEDGCLEFSTNLRTGALTPQDSEDKDPKVAETDDWRFTPRQLFLAEPSAVVLALLQFFYTQCICTPLGRHPSIVASLLIFSRLYGLEQCLGRWARHAADVLLGSDLVPDALDSARSFAESSVPSSTPQDGQSTPHSSATSGMLKESGLIVTSAERSSDLSVEECHRLSHLLYEAAGLAGFKALQVRAMRNIVVLAKFLHRYPHSQEQSLHGRSSSQGNSSSQLHSFIGQHSSTSSIGTPRRPGEPIRSNTSSLIPLSTSRAVPHSATRPSSSSGTGSSAAYKRPVGSSKEPPASGRFGRTRPGSSSTADASRLSSEDAEYMSQQTLVDGAESFGRGGLGRSRGSSKADRILGLSGGDASPSIREDGSSYYSQPRKSTVSSVTSVGSSGSSKTDVLSRQGGVGGVANNRKRFSIFGRSGGGGETTTSSLSLAGDELSEREEEGSSGRQLNSVPVVRSLTGGSVGRGGAGRYDQSGGPHPTTIYDSPVEGGMSGRQAPF